MLLAQKRTNSVNVILLKDALKRFNRDQGVIKIGIEYYLRRDLVEAERLIAYYKQTFAKTSKDMLRYEIVLNMQKKDYNKVSELFQKNFSPEILQEYWAFASGSMREKDLLFLSKDNTYSPFCRALLLLNKGNVKQSCDLLEKADAKNNYELLFFAAKTLGENGRHRAALEKYALFPQESPYQIAVWLNMAELYAESGNADQALILAQRAYNKAPQMPETQLCYADKLHRKGRFEQIPDIVKLSSAARYRKPMEKLWIAGIEHRIKKYDINTQREKIRELCRQLKVIAPDNAVALEYTKKLNKMPQ
jgi:tetratricopeptide (TPR) repeat protein